MLVYSCSMHGTQRPPLLAAYKTMWRAMFMRMEVDAATLLRAAMDAARATVASPPLTRMKHNKSDRPKSIQCLAGMNSARGDELVISDSIDFAVHQTYLVHARL